MGCAPATQIVTGGPMVVLVREVVTPGMVWKGEQMTKICGKCGKRKPVFDFYMNKRTADKLHGWCKSCCIKAAKIWQKINKDRINFNKTRKRAAKRALNTEIDY